VTAGAGLERVVEVLARSEAFAALPPDALRTLAYLVAERRVADGDLLFAEGEAGSEAFVVLAGEVEILQRDGDRGERVVRRLGEGELFGELALFGVGRPTAGARARGEVTVAALAHERFVEVIRAFPDVALALLRLQTRRFLELERRRR
jgi:CRP/FNR family transcriptional regulator